MSKRSAYKPLLFTTTIRNPKRTKLLLNILNKYNGEILTNKLAVKVMGELVRFGLYRPVKGLSNRIIEKWGSKKISDKSVIGNELLSNEDTDELLNNNPQKHKETGFDYGWPSRFATVFDFAKELGFVYYSIGKNIEFSEIGLMLVNSIEINVSENYISVAELNPEFEQHAFLNAFVKYQRSNPFRSVLNKNAPLLLLLEVINKLNLDEDLNNSGISKLELPLIIYWKDNNANDLYLRIKKLREDYGYSPSWEIISDICRNEIMEGRDIVRNNKSIMVDYPDEFIRKMRLTGLITLRGGGRFIDINRNEKRKIDYILKKYSTYNQYSSEEDYFRYISSIDKNLVSYESKHITLSEKKKYIDKWVEVYSWNEIKYEMLNLANNRLSKDKILKYLSGPVRLEFLTALAVKKKYPKISVVPNYPIDDEGIPTSTAGGSGNQGDIECFEDLNAILIEVTMSSGRTQTIMEVWPIKRHLKQFSVEKDNTMCYFIAPTIYEDSFDQIQYVRDKDNLNIVPKSIKEFIDHLELTKELFIE
ncbi:AlwI family type II restriction endonuclease [Patescibacteria group bacterium]|nr:AlwI family type II restriction endonuclease [Patescibacteria group bacterium]MBU1951847.1 AlwI family type II restriction endonuclease [Patescibacteria group bacterium]MBU2236091.1 AlwI family type II restriction endonuclease [Patescibacteria group bacterium]